MLGKLFINALPFVKTGHVIKMSPGNIEIVIGPNLIWQEGDAGGKLFINALPLVKTGHVMKMSPGNIAIVIGPNLIWPEVDAG